MTDDITGVWFKKDLRIKDNPALYFAAKTKHRLFCFYIDERAENPKMEKWKNRALNALRAEIRKIGGELYLFEGSGESLLPAILQKIKITRLYFNFDPENYEKERRLIEKLKKKDVEASGFYGSMLFEAGEILNSQGLPYRVFSPFFQQCLKRANFKLLPAVKKIKSFSPHLKNLKMKNAADLEKTKVGTKEAEKRLHHFLEHDISSYAISKDFLDYSTSRLSTFLHFGEISLKEVWLKAKGRPGSFEFLRELVWREFAYQTVIFFPRIVEISFKEEFEKFPWKYDNRLFKLWKEGKTGFPIVDAGMRDLKTSGFISNRMRMIVASFLVKNLLLPWQKGASWFLKTLIDGDRTVNAMNWQWIAGCGIDAAPFFRIFNPLSQSKKFDPQGKYIRRHVPELKDLKNSEIHFPGSVSSYPPPICNFEKSRKKALTLYFHFLKRKARKVKIRERRMLNIIDVAKGK